MHINRARLLEIAAGSLDKMSSHFAYGGRTWGEVLDMDFVKWLTAKIALLDPKRNCIMVGDKDDWVGLDPAKSMLMLKDGLGLPIGNLTSQLFSNVYLNVLDQYMKRELRCRYYGRYVDDAAVVSHDKEWLLSLVPRVRVFLKDKLDLDLHMGKLEVSEVHQGVEFLGMYIKPYVTYISSQSLARMEKKIGLFDYTKPWAVVRSVNSYLGIFGRANVYRICRRLFIKREVLRVCVFDHDMEKAVDRKVYYRRRRF